MRSLLAVSLLLVCFVDHTYETFADFISQAPSEVAKAFSSAWTSMTEAIKKPGGFFRPGKGGSTRLLVFPLWEWLHEEERAVEEQRVEACRGSGGSSNCLCQSRTPGHRQRWNTTVFLTEKKTTTTTTKRPVNEEAADMSKIRPYVIHRGSTQASRRSRKLELPLLSPMLINFRDGRYNYHQRDLLRI